MMVEMVLLVLVVKVVVVPVLKLGHEVFGILLLQFDCVHDLVQRIAFVFRAVDSGFDLHLAR